MPEITNNGRENVDFIVSGSKPKDGVPVTESLAPGETRNINTDLDHPFNQGRILSGLVTVAGRETRSTRAPKPE